jgi:general secretion pathway protein G
MMKADSLAGISDDYDSCDFNGPPGNPHMTRLQTQGMPAIHRIQRGFTLIELMVVLLIIGVLSALIVPSVLDRLDQGKITGARSDINTIVQALKMYKLDNQRYPSSEQGLQALVSKPTTNPIPPNWRPYLEKLPNDPWTHPYQYANPGVKGEIDVFSFGADGTVGGEGVNADIGSWQ